MRSWASEGLKIACGLVLGYGLLFVYVAIFDLALLPIVQVITEWLP